MATAMTAVIHRSVSTGNFREKTLPKTPCQRICAASDFLIRHNRLNLSSQETSVPSTALSADTAVVGRPFAESQASESAASNA